MSVIEFVAPADVTEKQASDTATALALLSLLSGIALHKTWPLTLSAGVLVVVMLAPFAFRYPAVVWFGLAQILGTVSSRILLTLLFFALVVPVGLWRRARGRDPLRLRAFRKRDDSLFLRRNQRFTRADLIHPF